MEVAQISLAPDSIPLAAEWIGRDRASAAHRLKSPIEHSSRCFSRFQAPAAHEVHAAERFERVKAQCVAARRSRAEEKIRVRGRDSA